MSAQHPPGPESWTWDDIVEKQRDIAERSIGDDRAYEFECLAAMEEIRDRENAAITKATGSAKPAATDPHANGCPDSPGICECFPRQATGSAA